MTPFQKKNLILFLTSIIFIAGCAERKIDTAKTIIAELSNRFIPDKRTDICTIEAFPGGKDVIILKGETTVPRLRQTLLDTLGKINIRLIDSILILPDTVVNKRYLGLACLSTINLRKEPDHSSELVSQAILGTPVMVLKSDHGWLQVRTPDKYISWTEKSSLRLVNVHEMEEWKHTAKVVYVENTGWICSNTSCSGITGDVVSGSIMAVTGESGDMLKIMLPDGREGFVKKDAVITYSDFMNMRQPEGDYIISRASKLMGVPYLWGGSSSKGVDCSGFVQTVFFINGLILPRDASQQALCGDPVDITKDFAALQKGDLLFFGSPGRVSHVAIYKGDTEYLHSSGRVMVNSLDSTRSNYSPYRRSTLVKAMRILGSKNEGIQPINKHPWY